MDVSIQEFAHPAQPVSTFEARVAPIFLIGCTARARTNARADTRERRKDAKLQLLIELAYASVILKRYDLC